MKIKKSNIWMILASGLILTASAAFVYPDFTFHPDITASTAQAAQADRSETTANGIESSSSIVTRVQASNPLEILTAGAQAIDSGTEVTVYNNNLALVKEKRELDLDSGVNRVEYKDVAALIDPTSVMFEDTKNKNTVVLEQNYEYDLMSSQELLGKFLDKEITVTEKEGGTYTGVLMSYDDNKGLVLRLSAGKVVTLSEISKVEFPDSAGLLTKPTLIWQVYSTAAGKRDVLTSYLTNGMSWKANYIVKTSADDKKADIQGWVTVNNEAGTTYENAKLKLVAGEVNRVTAPQETPARKAVAEEGVAYDEAVESFVEESFFEYHLYTLQRPATLRNNQVKQLSLLSVNSVPVEKELVFDVSKSSNVQVALSLNNSKEKGLGMPLPAGVLRVYKTDSEGQLQFLGEDNIKHTPKDEEIKVVVGNSFDVTGKRTQINYDKISSNVWKESYETEIKNHKSESQKVKIVENFYGDWEITTTSDPYEKKDAYTAEWEITIPADGSKKVTYTVERSY
ncbi:MULTISPECIES: DUF4139 domain-containing protein [Methanosarcina]|uniref:DUF4139 domain-containing protein n=3 Tax=Methanosarcina barkeri TaxID=2208 RepID=A0A0E3QSC3_METBA|nr:MULTISPECIES: DUF4139 domain-containing protein [Methanosarcina]AKB53734.1 hypothetical protein MSBRM_0736 [Methanosarcina barkeri MS]AKB58156.1 hypothetical protein MSBR2_1640 [Methanosarcina barkeri 227]AKJ38936.1 hypothetical protein MCM1_1912 [Methanosarcina barkeri CM1]OEC96446.1 DUF4139 domain-containing protein [Methanosarcina sp. A14]